MNVLLFTVPGSTGSFTCSWIGVFSGTLVSALNGFVLTTTGITTSGPVPVVKCVVCPTTAFPARSVTPDTASGITVLSGSGQCGTSSALWLLLVKLIESATYVVP